MKQSAVSGCWKEIDMSFDAFFIVANFVDKLCCILSFFIELVLDALWEGNKPYVYTAPGYSHDGLISDKVEVRMQLNVIHHGAMYICILPSEKLEEMRTCEIPKIRGTGVLI